MRVYYQRWYSKGKGEREYFGFTLHASEDNYHIYVNKIVEEGRDMYISDAPVMIELDDEVENGFLRMFGVTGDLRFFDDVPHSEVNRFFLDMIRFRLRTEVTNIERQMTYVFDY